MPFFKKKKWVECPECNGEGGHFETRPYLVSVAAGSYDSTQTVWVRCKRCKQRGQIKVVDEDKD